MGLLTEIKDLLKLVAYNQKAARWLVIIAILLGAGGFLYYKNIYKPPAEADCTFIKQQNRELLSFILEAQKQVKELAQPTSFLQHASTWPGIAYAISIDTIPKKETKQQKAVILLSKFDSLLLKLKQDSIERTRKKSKQ